MRVISAGGFLSPRLALFGEAGGACVVGAQLGGAHDEVALHGAHVAFEHGLFGPIVDIETPRFNIDGRRRIGLEHAHGAALGGGSGLVGELLDLLLGGLRSVLLAAIEARRDASRFLARAAGR